MLPVIHVGPWSIITYQLVYVLMILITGSVAYVRTRNFPARPNVVRAGLLVMIAALMIGFTLPSLFSNTVDYIQSGHWHGGVGLASYAGIAFSLLVMAIYARIYRLPFAQWCDRVFPVLALGYGITRLACLAAGCCGGKETGSIFGMYLPGSDGVWAARYPTQIINCAAEILVFAGLVWLDSWRKKGRGPLWLRLDGTIALLYLLYFCLERFALDFLRADHLPVWGAVSQIQAVMLAGAGILTASLILRAARPSKQIAS